MLWQIVKSIFFNRLARIKKKANVILEVNNRDSVEKDNTPGRGKVIQLVGTRSPCRQRERDLTLQ